ncbi:MAG: hypothetical protein IIV75_02810, partial [Lachnospiraceae bacterium]|nr:hypothetical protein [Lachnospiraceae bacterium]
MADFDPDKYEDMEEEVVEKVALVEDEPVDEAMFDWEQVDDEAYDLFNDPDYYPEGVNMTYEANEEAKTVKLAWVLKNGTTEDAAMAYAAELVQKFNDIMAVQTADIARSDMESFGGVWEQFALDLQISTEDGTMLIEKSYAAGDAIDLKLPEYEGDGPMSQPEELVGPGGK